MCGFRLVLAAVVLCICGIGAYAQDVGHTCVAYCDGDPAPSGGGGGGGGWSIFSAPDDGDEDTSPASVATTINNQGVALTKRGDHAAAIKLFRRALQINPNNVTARRNLATSEAKLRNERASRAFKTRDWALAIKLWHDALRYLPNNNSIKASIAIAEAQRAADNDDWVMAADLFRKVYREHNNSKDKSLYSNIVHSEAMIAAQKGDYTLALKKMREARQLKRYPSRDTLIAKFEGKLAEQQEAQRLAQQQAEQKSKQQEQEKAQQQAAQQAAQRDSEAAKNAKARELAAGEAKRIGASRSAYEQAQEAKIQGDKAKSGSDLEAKIQSSMPFDNRSVQQGGGDVHFQKSASILPPPLIRGVPDDQLKNTLDRTPQGHALLANLMTMENNLRRTQAEIETLRSSPNAAANPDYSKALIEQDRLLHELTPLQKQAQEIVTKVVLDKPKDAAALKPDIDHLAVPSPATGDSKSSNPN